MDLVFVFLFLLAFGSTLGSCVDSYITRRRVDELVERVRVLEVRD